MYADPSKVHEIVHTGPYFSAKGLLTVPPSPQRTPTLFQAGASSQGRDLAAKYAEAVFLAAEPTAMAEQVADIRRRARAFGRSADSIKFLMAGTFRVAATAASAQLRRESQIALGTLEEAAAAYAFFTGLDLMSMDLDKPLVTTSTETGRTNVERFTGAGGAGGPGGPGGAPALTVREILEEFRRNHVMGAPFLGDPGQVVDQACSLLSLTGADGFLVQPDWAGGFDSFIDLVMPELSRRGLLAAVDRTGLTLREQLFGAGHSRLPSDHPGYRGVSASLLWAFCYCCFVTAVCFSCRPDLRPAWIRGQRRTGSPHSLACTSNATCDRFLCQQGNIGPVRVLLPWNVGGRR